MQNQENRGQKHGQDQGQMPNRNRTGVQETPEQGTYQPSDKPSQAEGERDVTQNVTTNPREVGAGGGGTPLGRHGQDSRAWSSEENNLQGDGSAQLRGDRQGVKPEPKDQDKKGMAHPRNR